MANIIIPQAVKDDLAKFDVNKLMYKGTPIKDLSKQTLIKIVGEQFQDIYTLNQRLQEQIKKNELIIRP